MVSKFTSPLIRLQYHALSWLYGGFGGIQPFIFCSKLYIIYYYNGFTWGFLLTLCKTVMRVFLLSQNHCVYITLLSLLWPHQPPQYGDRLAYWLQCKITWLPFQRVQSFWQPNLVGLGVWVWSFRFGIFGLEFLVWGFGVLNLGFWVWGFGFGVRGTIFNYYQPDLVVK